MNRITASKLLPAVVLLVVSCVSFAPAQAAAPTSPISSPTSDGSGEVDFCQELIELKNSIAQKQNKYNSEPDDRKKLLINKDINDLRNQTQSLVDACNQKQNRKKESIGDVTTECKKHVDDLREKNLKLVEKCRDAFPGSPMSACISKTAECFNKAKDPNSVASENAIRNAMNLLGGNPAGMQMSAMVKSWEDMVKQTNEFLPKDCRTTGWTTEKLQERRKDLKESIETMQKESMRDSTAAQAAVRNLEKEKTLAMKKQRELLDAQADAEERIAAETEAKRAREAAEMADAVAKKSQLETEMTDIGKAYAEETTPLGRETLKQKCLQMLTGGIKGPNGEAGMAIEKPGSQNMSREYRLNNKWLPQCMNSMVASRLSMALKEVQRREAEISRINQKLNADYARQAMGQVRQQMAIERRARNNQYNGSMATYETLMKDKEKAEMMQSSQMASTFSSTMLMNKMRELGQIEQTLAEGNQQKTGTPGDVQAAATAYYDELKKSAAFLDNFSESESKEGENGLELAKLANSKLDSLKGTGGVGGAASCVSSLHASTNNLLSNFNASWNGLQESVKAFNEAAAKKKSGGSDKR